MNGFHVQAVGWVLVFNVRALSPDERRRIVVLWNELLRAQAEDRARAGFQARLLAPRLIRLSTRSVAALKELMEQMVALHPERFDYRALRGRCHYWALQAALSLVLGVLAMHWAPRGAPLANEAVLALLIMSYGFLVPTVTLWRAARAVKTLTLGAPAAEMPDPAHGPLRG